MTKRRSTHDFLFDELTILTSLVPYLKARGEAVTLREAATHFNTSEATMRDLVTMLSVSGKPQLDDYSGTELFDLNFDALDDGLIEVTHFVALEDAPPLGNRDLAALLMGLNYLASLASIADPIPYRELIAKLGGDPTIVATRDEWLSERAELIRDAMSEGRQLEFTYRSPRRGERSLIADPSKVLEHGHELYLRAWSYEHDAYRTFRLDRMTKLTMLDTPAKQHPAEDEAPVFSYDDSVMRAEIRFSPVAHEHISEYLDTARRVSKPDREGWRRATALVTDWSVLARLATRHAGHLEVVEPADARRAVAEWTAAATRRSPFIHEGA